MTETWIIYKAETMDDPEWEKRQLMPSGSLTDILWENWDYSGKLPAVGDRIREYLQDEDTGKVTHARDGDWVVTQMHQFNSINTEMRIVLCYCQFQAIDRQWEQLQRGKPVDEILSAEVVKVG
ncbi:MAG: hypothetical protein EBE86_003295 [Hormoscilla sp. GUM202]|nr:hypothetical protein [Hormoscilla sp. GM7CHS1pb]MBO1346476.1 hypothetical protein [Hormoscilla sp. GUM202]